MILSRAELELALRALDPEVWRTIPRNLFSQPTGHTEFSATWTDAGELVGISRQDFSGDTIRRALVIAPDFQGTAQSLELTAAELQTYFSRGVRAVEYRVALSHAVATARVQLLGAEQRGAPLYGHQAWQLSADNFDRDALRAVAERRTHVQDPDRAKRVRG